MSVSLASTLIVVASASSSTVAASSTAVGGSSTQVTRHADGRGRAAVQGVGEVVGRRAVVAVVRVRRVAEAAAAHGNGDSAVGRVEWPRRSSSDRRRCRCRWPARRSWSRRSPRATVSASSTAVGGSSTQVTRHADGRGRAAVQRVGEVVGRRAVVAVVRVRRVAEAAAAHGNGDSAVGRVSGRGDRLRTAVDVGVVAQHVDRGRVGVLGHRGRVVDRRRRVVHAGDASRGRSRSSRRSTCR